MSKMVDISDEVYARLEQQARANGSTVPQVIAQLTQEMDRAHLAVAIERLQAKGILLVAREPALSPPPGFQPIRVQGQPLSEMIIEERR